MPAENFFAMPVALEIDEKTATPLYAKFNSAPWEKGFGHTLGNALRRVLLSSLEGVAATTIKIDGVPHEFTTIPDVVEDVTEIILAIKQVRFKCIGDLPRKLELYADKAGVVTAGAIREDGVTTVLNADLPICTLDADRPLRIELEIDRGRGYRQADLNKSEDQPIGVIPIDSLFSPIQRVRYDVQAFRVGMRTDYDNLELEVWTDGRVTPEEAVITAASLLQKHLAVFTQSTIEEVVAEQTLTEDEQAMLDLFCRNVSELNLSVRAKNCLHNAAIETIGELIQKQEAEMLKYRNFGKKSLDEIKVKLQELNLGLDTVIAPHLVKAMEQRLQKDNEEE